MPFKVSPLKSACDKVSPGVGIVPFESPRSRNQVSNVENWAFHVLRPISDGNSPDLATFINEGNNILDGLGRKEKLKWP
jgi:hypothetical protein